MRVWARGPSMHGCVHGCACCDAGCDRSGFAVVGDGGEGFADGFELREDGGVEVVGEIVGLAVGGSGEVDAVLVEAFAVHEGLNFLVGLGDAGDIEVAEFDEDGGDVAHGEFGCMAAGNTRWIGGDRKICWLFEACL